MPSTRPYLDSKVSIKIKIIYNTILLTTIRVGVEKVDISLEKQEVVVDTELPRETVLAAIKKTGKEVKEE